MDTRIKGKHKGTAQKVKERVYTLNRRYQEILERGIPQSPVTIVYDRDKGGELPSNLKKREHADQCPYWHDEECECGVNDE
jgi:hypothetical protein